MKVKRYLCAFAAMLIMLSGCGASRTPGRVENITTAELVGKMNNEEDFAIVFTQTTCGHCQTFMNMMDEYLPDHNLVLYDLILDYEPDRNQALDELNTLFPDFNGTPDIYYVEKGQIKSRFWDEYANEGLSESTFHQWVKENNLLDR